MPSSSSSGSGDPSTSASDTSAARAPVAPPQSPGEYIDITFDRKKPSDNTRDRKTSESGNIPGGSSQQQTGSGSQQHSITHAQARLAYSVQHEYSEIDYEKEHYALMGHGDSETGALKLSPGSPKVTPKVTPKASPKTSSKSHRTPASLESAPAAQGSPPVSSAELLLAMKSHAPPAPAQGGGGAAGPASHSSPAESSSHAKPQKEPSPKSGSKPRLPSTVEQSSAAAAASSGSTGRKLSSPLATFLHGLSQAGRRSPKGQRSSGSASPKVTAEENAEGSRSPLKRSESASPNPPSQFTKTPPLSVQTVTPNAIPSAPLPTNAVSAPIDAARPVTSGPTSGDRASKPSTPSAPAQSPIRAIRSAGNLSALDPSTPGSRIHVTSPKILLTSSELISEISSSSAPKMGDKRGSTGSQENPGTSDYANMAFDKKTSRQSSHSSMSSSCDPELHYVSLDLGASAEDVRPELSSSGGGRSPGGKSRHGSGGSAVTTGSWDEHVPLQYAQIDFDKSGSPRTHQQQEHSVSEDVAKETPAPFDVADMAPTGVMAAAVKPKVTAEPFDLP